MSRLEVKSYQTQPIAIFKIRLSSKQHQYRSRRADCDKIKSAFDQVHDPLCPHEAGRAVNMSRFKT
jgi:hypothetical protein